MKSSGILQIALFFGLICALTKPMAVYIARHRHRFLMIIPLLAAAGTLAEKKRVPVISGTLPTHGPMFAILLISTIVLISALTYFPAWSLGPIVEHSLMHADRLFP